MKTKRILKQLLIISIVAIILIFLYRHLDATGELKEFLKNTFNGVAMIFIVTFLIIITFIVFFTKKNK